MTESLHKFYVYEAAHNFLMNIIFEASWVPQEQVSRFLSSWLCKKMKIPHGTRQINGETSTKMNKQ